MDKNYNSLQECIDKNIDDDSVVWVFNSDVSRQWIRYLSKKYGKPVAKNRFLSFDDLKSEIYETENIALATNLHRQMFVLDFLEKNANSNPKLLKKILLPEHAGNYKFIEGYITKILPQLKAFFDLGYDTKLGNLLPQYIEDLKTILKAYTSFLKQHNLYEKSWDEMTLENDGNTYVFVYPETFSDYNHFENHFKIKAKCEIIGFSKTKDKTADKITKKTTDKTIDKTTDKTTEKAIRVMQQTLYQSQKGETSEQIISKIEESIKECEKKGIELSALQSRVVELTKEKKLSKSDIVVLHAYKNSALEFQDTMKRISELVKSGVDPNEIIITMPDAVSNFDALQKEATNFDLELQLRMARPLGDFPIVQLFSDISELVSTNMSYEAMKRFLTNPTYPFKNRSLSKDDLIYEILKIGLKKCCYANTSKSYKDDVWFSAIKSLTPKRKDGSSDTVYEEDEEDGVEDKYVSYTQDDCDRFMKFYKGLKGACYGLLTCKKFSLVKAKLNHFFKKFFICDNEDEDKVTMILSKQNENLLTRAMSVLDNLVNIEKSIEKDSKLKIDSSAYSFFLKNVISQTYNFPPKDDGSIKVYNYGSSFCIPSQYHFMINTKEGGCNFDQIHEVKFISADLIKNYQKNIDDEVLSCYLTSSSNVIVSYSLSTYNRAAMPCVWFLKETLVLKVFNMNAKDNYAYLEKQRWARHTDELPLNTNQASCQGFESYIKKRNETESKTKDTANNLNLSKASINKIKDSRKEIFYNDDTVVISASKIDRYTTCKMRFFYDKVHSIHKIGQISLTNNMVEGNFYHSVLQNVYGNLIDNGFTIHNDDAMTEVSKLLLNLKNKNSFAFDMYRPIYLIYKNKRYRYLESFLHDIMFKNFKDISLGKKELNEAEIDVGRADKLIYDEINNRIIIIDYKKKGYRLEGAFKKEFEKTAIIDDKFGLQVLIYALNKKEDGKGLSLHYLGIEDQKCAHLEIEVENTKDDNMHDYLKLAKAVEDKYKEDITNFDFSKTCYSVVPKEIAKNSHVMTIKSRSTKHSDCKDCSFLSICRNRYTI